MAQIYGFAYHSPLFLVNLTPRLEYTPLYLESRWVARDVVKNTMPLVASLSGKKPLIIAGSLLVLKAFLKGFPALKNAKVILCEFPGLINPFKDPLIEWVDCDHQHGGAWMTLKLKYETFSDLLGKMPFLDAEGRNLIERMTRWQSRDRINEIEKFNESVPNSYKDLVDYEATDITDTDKAYDAAKDHSWKRKFLIDLIKDVVAASAKQDREQIINIILDYQLSLFSKREFNLKMKLFIDNPVLKKKVTLLRKWIDDAKHGRLLFQAYLDYLCNLEKRSWKTILEDSAISELDLLVVIARQPCRNNEIALRYTEEAKEVREFPPNMHLPEASVLWPSTGTFHYHPEVPVLPLLFDF